MEKIAKYKSRLVASGRSALTSFKVRLILLIATALLIFAGSSTYLAHRNSLYELRLSVHLDETVKDLFHSSRTLQALRKNMYEAPTNDVKVRYSVEDTIHIISPAEALVKSTAKNVDAAIRFELEESVNNRLKALQSSAEEYGIQSFKNDSTAAVFLKALYDVKTVNDSLYFVSSGPAEITKPSKKLLYVLMTLLIVGLSPFFLFPNKILSFLRKWV